jgi:hypothetical protein
LGIVLQILISLSVNRLGEAEGKKGPVCIVLCIRGKYLLKHPALSVSKKKSVNVEKYLDQEAEEALPEADEVSDEGHRETERSRPGLVR